MEDRDLRHECDRVISEITPHVSRAERSQVLESSFTVSHMNICTKDEVRLCVRLTVRGFEVRTLCHIVFVSCIFV